jgi:seryl-tRNA(Sec) selenium transferase
MRAHGVRGIEVLARLRGSDPAVVARIKDETVGLDLRCIEDDELETLAQAVERALAGGGKPA